MNEYYLLRAKEQNEDLQTDRIRKGLKVSLTDKEYSSLKLLAYKAGFKSAGELLSSFVGDLTDWHTNGSDESDLASEWYERAFGMSEHYTNFIHYLYNHDYTLEDIADMLEDEDYFEDVYERYIDENEGKTNQTREECINVIKELIDKGEEL
ncbi:hypothetical protein UF75_2228 [Desulfosporosinus sp. I2]|uniref:hypothetical protein n=1 Tax=Desulfosporosinus sp. I2 TaxID=1617025 RepID=UPI0005EE0BE2|nr:hypothetical protein [Desulfosporosinus sp. I2]KJR47384.1 hypothetical protein UF75_2228 [Desulfosporosinus sp. I2]